ncbi:MAG: Signal recognition particle protein [Gammaproteobacteria bacterium]|nr:Signal recognition particle protein [Gammaproteobacteria bacterium]
MFDQLSERLQRTLKQVRGQARLTEDNIKNTLREVRIALLEADVALPVVKALVDRVRERAVGREVLSSLTPGQMLVKVVRDELTVAMGERNDALNLSARAPVVVLLAGLQGTGKTTTAAKLGRWLATREKKSVAVASTDVYRPAAIDQLRTLARQNDLDFCDSDKDDLPVDIATRAVEFARKNADDVLLLDTAGRLHVDQDMMAEVRAIHECVQPTETLFVVDSMVGQDAVHSAQAFNEALPLTGVILTKTDGDARGGAALSVRRITGKPIKFLGTGEKSDALEPFHPDRVVSRILGMGDVLSLVEDVEHHVDQDKARHLVGKIKKGKGFDLNDLRDQMQQMRKMGGLAGMLKKIPGASELPAGMADRVDEKQITKTVAIVDSMTPHERAYPAVIRGSRKKRIAAGSGTGVPEVNRLLKQFQQMQKMMKRMKKKSGMPGTMPGMPKYPWA